MQQLSSLLIAPTTSLKSGKSTGVEAPGFDANSDQSAQKFALHLTQLTEPPGQKKQHSDSDARTSLSGLGPSKDSTAVADLARTMLQTTEDDGLAADDTWLFMVEELNSIVSGDLSLEELSARHGIDAMELESQLNQALVEFEGDMAALIVQLEQLSGGKALPPASSEQLQAQHKRSKIADASAEKHNKTDKKDARIAALLQHIETLSPSQKRQFAESVNDLMDQLGERDMSDLSAQQLSSLESMPTHQLTKLRDILQSQVGSLLDSDVNLSSAQKTQLDTYLAMLDKLDQLPLHTSLSELKNSQQLADDLAQLEFPTTAPGDATPEVVAAIQALFSNSLESSAEGDPPAWLQTVDMKALQKDVDQMLAALDGEVEGLSGDELMALLQTQLQALKLADSDLQGKQPEGENLARLNQLLSELNQKLELAGADVRVINASPHLDTASGLTPVAQALAHASQHLRAQVQTALQVSQQNGDEADEADLGDFDGLRRLISETVASSTEPRSITSSSAAGMQTAQYSTPGQAASAQSTQVRTAEQPTQSAFETARQSQQAIDILGTGASERLREQVSVMFNSRTQAAEMRLDPPDLGRLNIRLNMNQEQATVSFQVTTPQAREALEQNLPRLRELLAEQGIELADANVSEQQQDGSRESTPGQGHSTAQSGTEAEESESIVDRRIEITSEIAAADGRVDYYV